MARVEHHIRRLTSKGQVTVPAQIRKLLKLRPEGDVIFRVTDGRVEILPMPMTLEQAFGSVTPHKQQTSEAMSTILAEERAERWLKSEERSKRTGHD